MLYTCHLLSRNPRFWRFKRIFSDISYCWFTTMSSSRHFGLAEVILFGFWRNKDVIFDSISFLQISTWNTQWLTLLALPTWTAQGASSHNDKSLLLAQLLVQVNLCQKLLFLHQPTIWRQIIHWITSSVHENYKLRTSGEHVVYINCSWCQNKSKKQFVYTTCSSDVLSL